MIISVVLAATSEWNKSFSENVVLLLTIKGQLVQTGTSKVMSDKS